MCSIYFSTIKENMYILNIYNFCQSCHNKPGKLKKLKSIKKTKFNHWVEEFYWQLDVAIQHRVLTLGVEFWEGQTE